MTVPFGQLFGEFSFCLSQSDFCLSLWPGGLLGNIILMESGVQTPAKTAHFGGCKGCLLVVAVFHF